MRTTRLHDDFGVEVHDVDLRIVTAEVIYPELRALFEEHSLLLFRDQSIDEDKHLALARLYGPLENLTDGGPDETPPRPMVSNVAPDGTLAGEKDLQLLNLKSNFIWHTDSTFLATPSISNILIAYRVPSVGGETEFVSTRVGWQRTPKALRDRARSRVFLHRYAHSRYQLDETLAEQEMFTKWPDTPWRSTWRNPVNGKEALYIAAHAYGVRGMSDEDGQRLLNDLTEAVTRPESIFSHAWRAGDVLIWDQRATLHRGCPWPYEEERTLASIVSSAIESDGLASVRP
jgi:alpha-ketoglutarate-dependent 2,4-dichlorophenoxyacetate dioxygenase